MEALREWGVVNGSSSSSGGCATAEAVVAAEQVDSWNESSPIIFCGAEVAQEEYGMTAATLVSEEKRRRRRRLYV